MITILTQTFILQLNIETPPNSPRINQREAAEKWKRKKKKKKIEELGPVDTRPLLN